MIIGVPKEIKSNENRVALTPAGAMEFTRRGHSVYIETTAGVGSGFDDADYIEAGGNVLWLLDDNNLRGLQEVAEMRFRRISD